MAHMLASINREAADEIDRPTPLPDIGSTVVYIPRAGQVRAGKTRVPAIVTGRDVDNRLLDLVVIYDADDFLSKPRIPRRQGDDHGWELVGGQALSPEMAWAHEFRDHKEKSGEILGDVGSQLNELRNIIASVNSRVDAVDRRLDALEAKRGPGRPPNPRPQDNEG